MVGKIIYNLKDRKELIEAINARKNGKVLKKIEPLNDELKKKHVSYRIKECEKCLTIEING